MKILLDFRAYQEFYPRGVSRYVYELFSELLHQHKEPIGILLDKNKIKPIFPEEILQRITIYDVGDFENLDTQTFDLFINGSTTWLNVKGYQSIDTLYPESVLDKCRHKACILYDFVPLLYQKYIPDETAKINYALQLEAIQYMDFIFTLSQYTSKAASKYLNLPIEHLTCIYGGANTQKFTSPNSTTEYQASQRTNNLVAILGGCIRKNFLGLTKAFGIAHQSKKLPKNACLYILSCSSFESEILEIAKKYGCNQNKIKVLNYIADTEMLDLLANARASIFPSYYEGLGLPILESYVAGTPSFASNISSTKEFVLKEASFDPFNDNDIANMIIQIYQRDDLCKQSLEFGRNLIKTVNWENAAKTLLSTIKSKIEH